MDLDEQQTLDQISDSESTDSTHDSIDHEPEEDCVAKATTHKEQGNQFFQSSCFIEAKEQYQSGLKAVKRFQNVSGDGQSLFVSLNLNLAAVHNKLEEYKSTIHCLNHVLTIDENNIKALYRRGFARGQTGDYEGATNDFTKVLKQDPDNKDAKKQLRIIKEQSEKQKNEEKKKFQNFFGKVSVYEDKEQERLEKLRREEEEQQKLQNELQTENTRRLEAGEGELTLEEFKKKKDEEKKKQEKERKAKQRNAKSATKPKSTVTAELDEEDSKIVEETKKKGYCYFRREQTEEEKKLFADLGPKKIDFNQVNQDIPMVPTTESPQRTEQIKSVQYEGSAWNRGGTWEETNMSVWAKQNLESSLLLAEWCQNAMNDDPQSMAQLLSGLNLDRNSNSLEQQQQKIQELSMRLASIEAKVTSIKKCQGDASICVVRGTKRYLYDYNAELEWKVSIDESFGLGNESYGSNENEKNKVTKYSGTFEITELSSSVKHNEIEIATRFKKSPSSVHQQTVNKALAKLKSSIISRIESFESEYHKL